MSPGRREREERQKGLAAFGDSPAPSALCKFACLDPALLKAFFGPPHQSAGSPRRGQCLFPRAQEGTEGSVSPTRLGIHRSEELRVSPLRLGAP